MRGGRGALQTARDGSDPMVTRKGFEGFDVSSRPTLPRGSFFRSSHSKLHITSDSLIYGFAPAARSTDVLAQRLRSRSIGAVPKPSASMSACIRCLCSSAQSVDLAGAVVLAGVVALTRPIAVQLPYPSGAGHSGVKYEVEE